MIAAITVSAVRRRLGLCFQIHAENIHFEEVIGFLTHLHRQVRRKFIVVLDRYIVHRKAVRVLQAEQPD